MVNLTVDQMRELMGRPSNVRNMSVIAYGSDGEFTLTDSLLQNIITLPVAHHPPDEQERGKPTAISLYAKLSDDVIKDIKQKTKGTDFLIHLVDSARHVDYSSEVIAALRVTDGALVVVDCIEGVSVQTENVLRQAIGERIKPVAIINNVDRALLDLEITKEQLYQSFSKTVESINHTISTLDTALGDVQVSPQKGTVAFGSGPHGWAFTIRQFAMRYEKKFGVDRETMMDRLWGDNYFNPKTNKWTTVGKHGDLELDRAFNQFVLDPIFSIFSSVMNFKKDEIPTLLAKLEIELTSDEKNLVGKALLTVVMRKFLPAADALLEMIVIHLPSPETAQSYRAEFLYEGPADDENCIGIRECDPNGPLMLYVSKMVPIGDTGRYYAFGRVFSGTIKSGLKVRIQGPNYIPGKKDDLFIKTIERTVLMMGRVVEPIVDVPAGNILGLVGIDQFLLKSGTLTTSETAYNLKVMKPSVLPVVQVAVEVKNANDLPKLVEGLKRLSRSDPSVLTFISDTGEHIVGGANELHLEACLKELENDYAGVPLSVSSMFVQYRETVSSESSIKAKSISPNKYNGLSARASPLDWDLTTAIERGEITSKDDINTRAQILADDYDWDIYEARKIWCFGPDATSANICVDATSSADPYFNEIDAVPYLNEIKDSVVSGFQWATKEGPVAEEPMRSIRFNITDVTLHADAVYRGGDQLIPTARRVLYAATLLAEPQFLEPVYLVEIQVPEQAIGSIYHVLTQRRGQVISEEKRPGTLLTDVKAYLPVSESFGFAGELRSRTSGQAFEQSVFDHWDRMGEQGDCLKSWTKSGDLAVEMRVRKGLKPEVPTFDEYYDREEVKIEIKRKVRHQ